MKKLFLCIIVFSLLLLTACSKKDEQASTNTSGNDKKTIEVVENFTGVGGYIIQDNVFDYSERFEKVYEWCDGVKLPVPKFNYGKIEFISGRSNVGHHELYAMIEMTDYTESEFLEYVESLEKEGFTNIPDLSDGQDVYYMYKDNLIEVIFNTRREKGLSGTIYTIAGNVKENNVLSLSDARKIIDNSEILKENELFDEYVLFEISNETLREKGYLEYLVITPPNHYSDERQHLPFYVIIKDKEIVFSKQGGTSVKYPSNANIVEIDGEEKLIISSPELRADSSGLPFIGCVQAYNLSEGKFVLDDSFKDVRVDNTHLLAIVESGEIKYYTLKENDNFDPEKGYSDKWIIDKEYVLE